MRAREAQASAALLGVTYEILPFDDGRLTPSLEARETLMRTIRRFQPDVIFTNRPCDYHPDHRATGQLVQDCAYLLGVPAICPDTPPLRYTPVILYWHDPFTDPKPFRPDFARPARNAVSGRVPPRLPVSGLAPVGGRPRGPRGQNGSGAQGVSAPPV